jgi:transposase
MDNQTQFYVGIDVSKLWFDASLMAVVNHAKQDIITKRFTNDKTGIKQLFQWLKSGKVTFDDRTLVVLENTGIYHRLLWHFCTIHCLPIHIGNAAHIKWSFGIARGKNDVIDSKRLCQYAFKEADHLRAMPPTNASLMELKDLMTCRKKLKCQMNGILQHLKELKSFNSEFAQSILEKSHNAAIEGLKRSIQEIEMRIKQVLAEDEEIQRNHSLLKTIPGIGPLTAAYMICCTYNFHMKFTGKQLACYAGVAPFEHSSGTSIKGRNRVHKMANKDLKSMLHLASLACITRYPEFKYYYERKKQEGKHSLTVINAVKNKLVLRIASVINNQKPYEEKHSYESQTFHKKYLEKS